MNFGSTDPFESYPIDNYDESRLSPFLREVRRKALQRQKDREDCGLWDDETEPMPTPCVTITSRTAEAGKRNASPAPKEWHARASALLRHADKAACESFSAGLDRIESDPRRSGRGRAVLEATREAVDYRTLEIMWDEIVGEEDASA